MPSSIDILSEAIQILGPPGQDRRTPRLGDLVVSFSSRRRTQRQIQAGQFRDQLCHGWRLLEMPALPVARSGRPFRCVSGPGHAPNVGWSTIGM